MEFLSLYFGPTSVVVLNRLKPAIGNACTYTIWYISFIYHIWSGYGIVESLIWSYLYGRP
jgi:hypothetical protein